jgi:hypothetical protein
MADKKISALTAAALPLAGSEVLPIVQSGSTVKVSSDDLTVKNIRSNASTGLLQVAGPAASTTRVMTTPNANFTAARTDAAQTFGGDQTFSSGLYTLGGTRKYYVYTDAADNFRVVRYDLAGGYQGLPFEIDVSSNVKVTTGNLVIGTAGKGIDFSANGGDILTQYDEGTWTPVVTAAVGSVTTYTAEGSYTRIGRMVTACAKVIITVPGTADFSMLITLPFTPVGAGFSGSSCETALTGFSGKAFGANGDPNMYVTDYANGTYFAAGATVYATLTYFV